MSEPTIRDAVRQLQRALAMELGPGAIVALTRLQFGKHHVTYRGQPLREILYFSDPKGQEL